MFCEIDNYYSNTHFKASFTLPPPHPYYLPESPSLPLPPFTKISIHVDTYRCDLQYPYTPTYISFLPFSHYSSLLPPLSPLIPTSRNVSSRFNTIQHISLSSKSLPSALTHYKDLDKRRHI